jgi:hypothetical protein
MEWTPWFVSFRLISPLHIGCKKIGNLQVTRPYVPGKTLWGALTARLVRDEGDNNYNDVGVRVNKELRLSYFYPSTSQDNVELWPWDNREWDNRDDFNWKFIGSYVSTALDGDTAEEGSLHEVEYISPTTRDGSPVFLVGYIFEKTGCQLKWKEALKRIQLGGERGYGWGRIELIGEPVKKCSFFNSYVFDCAGSDPGITVEKNKPILAHAQIEGLDCHGTIEPLVGRETDNNKRFGGVLSRADICWLPGSIVKESEVFRIIEHGIWGKT